MVRVQTDGRFARVGLDLSFDIIWVFFRSYTPWFHGQEMADVKFRSVEGTALPTMHCDNRPLSGIFKMKISTVTFLSEKRQRSCPPAVRYLNLAWMVSGFAHKLLRPTEI